MHVKDQGGSKCNSHMFYFKLKTEHKSDTQIRKYVVSLLSSEVFAVHICQNYKHISHVIHVPIKTHIKKLCACNTLSHSEVIVHLECVVMKRLGR